MVGGRGGEVGWWEVERWGGGMVGGREVGWWEVERWDGGMVGGGEVERWDGGRWREEVSVKVTK